MHDEVVKTVASRRLSYPNGTHQDWKTETNPDQQKNFYVQTKAGDMFYPDVVVVDTTAKLARMIGEVETESTIDDESAEQWSDYSGLVEEFYLYVPEGTEAEAARLLIDNKIACAGLRVYTLEDSTVNFRIVE